MKGKNIVSAANFSPAGDLKHKMNRSVGAERKSSTAGWSFFLASSSPVIPARAIHND